MGMIFTIAAIFINKTLKTLLLLVKGGNDMVYTMIAKTSFMKGG